MMKSGVKSQKRGRVNPVVWIKRNSALDEAAIALSAKIKVNSQVNQNCFICGNCTSLASIIPGRHLYLLQVALFKTYLSQTAGEGDKTCDTCLQDVQQVWDLRQLVETVQKDISSIVDRVKTLRKRGAVSGEIPCSEDNNENTNKDMKIEADQVGEGEELSRPLPCQLMNSNINNAIRVEPLSRPNLRFSCFVCGKIFKTSRQVQHHILTHADPKPYSCELCSKSFSIKHTLQRHMKIHTGDKPYKCSFCPKKFAERHNLKSHMIYVHDAPTPFICIICGRKFAVKSMLKKHQNKAHVTTPTAQSFDE